MLENLTDAEYIKFVVVALILVMVFVIWYLLDVKAYRTLKRETKTSYMPYQENGMDKKIVKVVVEFNGTTHIRYFNARYSDLSTKELQALCKRAKRDFITTKLNKLEGR